MHTRESIPQAWTRDGHIHVEAAGRGWTLRRPASLEELWDAMDDDSFNDDHIPYWTELWPSSLALAYWLFNRKADIAGKTCLDLGCGLGFTALMGQFLGAKVMAVDAETEALRYCRLNALDNAIAEQPAWIAMDWREPAMAPQKIWRLWAGDIIYEKRFMKPVIDFMEFALAPDGAAWIAEPGRKIFDGFLDALAQAGWTSRDVLDQKQRAVHPQSALIGVHVWEIRRNIAR